MAAGRFVAYFRVSTQRQSASGLGLDAQRRAVLDHLNGGPWRLAAEFVEVEGGKREDRPKLARALAACRLRGATLIIAKLDRLTRNVAFVPNLMASGVEFVAVDSPRANRLTVHVLAAVAEHEREMVSARTKAALAAAKARGKALGHKATLKPGVGRGRATAAAVREGGGAGGRAARAGRGDQGRGLHQREGAGAGAGAAGDRDAARRRLVAPHDGRAPWRARWRALVADRGGGGTAAHAVGSPSGAAGRAHAVGRRRTRTAAAGAPRGAGGRGRVRDGVLPGAPARAPRLARARAGGGRGQGAAPARRGDPRRGGAGRQPARRDGGGAAARRALGVPFVLASAYERPDLVAPVLAGACNVGKPVDEARLLDALAQAPKT